MTTQLDIHQLLLEAMHQVRGIQSLAGQVDAEALECLTGSDLYWNLKPVIENLTSVLNVLESAPAGQTINVINTKRIG